MAPNWRKKSVNFFVGVFSATILYYTLAILEKRVCPFFSFFYYFYTHTVISAETSYR